MGFERKTALGFLADTERKLERVFPEIGTMAGGIGWGIQESGGGFWSH